MQIIVFGVNIDSPRKYQVRIGKVVYENTAAINRTDHSSPPVAIKQNFVPYQNKIPAGIPKVKHAKIGLFCHHCQTNCEFCANQPIVCPAIKKDIA
tara:strand:+ start:287 stop:574 length:288 start_codon:yes stop_codon:yes gene_type:complete